jgi:hypothetical protein
MCGSFACGTCGNCPANIGLFYCVICAPGLTLLPSGGFPPTGEGPGGGPGPSGPPSGGPGDVVGPYESSEQFEKLESVLAYNTSTERRYYHDHIERFLELPAEYSFDEARRERIDQDLDYQRPGVPAEQALRADFRRAAQRLTRDIEAANAGQRLREGLVADAFGVAQWAIGVPAGTPAPQERLGMLRDERLRFIVGTAAVAVGGARAPAGVE